MPIRSWIFWWEFFLLITGSIIGSIATLVFLLPSEIAPGGVAGIAVIMNVVWGVPMGLVIALGNLPIQWLGYRVLGGGRVLVMTVISLIVGAISLEVLAPFIREVTRDHMLNAIFGGILGGISSGLILRGSGTPGGTATLARILQHRFGLPLSSAYLYTDAGTILLAGVAFGWEKVLLAFVSLFVSGLATDYMLEGPSVIRTVTIITDHPEKVSQVLLKDLGRGVTAWEGTGMYTHKTHHVLFVTVHRAQVSDLKTLVEEADPRAFIVIGQGHVAYGYGFRDNARADRPTTTMEFN